MAEESKQYVDTGLCFKSYPVLLGARKEDSPVPKLADYLTLTRLDRCLFKYCRSIYEGHCDLQGSETMVKDAMSWPEGKGPKSIEERANEFIQSCMTKAGYKPKRWYQFWK